MTKLPHLNAGDFIAIITIIGCFTLIILGKSETTASYVLTSIIAFYFGKNANQNGRSGPQEKGSWVQG